MSKSTKVTVNDLHQFELSQDDVNALNQVQIAQHQFQIIQDHKSYTAEITTKDFQNRLYTVTINGTPYTVNIKSDLDDLINQMGLENRASKKIDVLNAPMPGLILDIAVNVGDRITAHTPLLVLEAMKMENSILSPRDAIIKRIAVNKADTVNKGDLLIEFE